jgi:hypothetical protein
VAGVLLEAARFADAVGAILLFATNATAIVATGTAVFLAYRVRDAAEGAGVPVGDLRGRTLAAVVGLVAVVAVPLGVGSATLIRDQRLQLAAAPIATRWAEDQGWQIVRVQATDGALEIVALGPAPEVDPELLRREIDAAGLADVDLQVDLVVGGTRELPGRGSR